MVDLPLHLGILTVLGDIVLMQELSHVRIHLLGKSYLREFFQEYNELLVIVLWLHLFDLVEQWIDGLDRQVLGYFLNQIVDCAHHLFMLAKLAIPDQGYGVLVDCLKTGFLVFPKSA